MSNLSADLQTALKAARAGAMVIRSQYGKVQDVQIKSDSNTLVTGTDKAAEAAILDVLIKESDYCILSEESGLTGSKNGPVWVVDPLDGTSNFARMLPLFAVSLALVRDAEILAGVIIDPIHGGEYYAMKGGGAFCNNTLLKPEKPLHKVPALFLNHGSDTSDKLNYAELTRRLSTDYNLRKLGTTALELCYVAAGLFDGFICSGDEIWDFAAGVLIASEAGSAFSDWKGRKWDGKGNYIMITRPELQAQLLQKTFDLQ
jgi:myo-inositol-1(or 4)-monophosphatase